MDLKNGKYAKCVMKESGKIGLYTKDRK